jgi:glycosyltransferase involved in cell wall biosynthesis
MTVSAAQYPLSRTAPLSVRVLMITYNHVAYVEQAVRSVMMQETSFAFDLVVLDDCSNDGTQDVLRTLARTWPDAVRLELSPVNRNNNVSFCRAFEEAPSRYIAWLDGDDYWNSPHKLQHHVEFMNAHPECALSFHDVLVEHDDCSRQPYRMCGSDEEQFIGLETLWSHVPVGACASMLRKGLVQRFPDWYHTVLLADWALYILHAMHGDIGYFPAVLGVYRVHRKGLWSSMTPVAQCQASIDFLENTKGEVDPKHISAIHRALAHKYHKLARLHGDQGQYLQAFSSLISCLRADGPRTVGSMPMLRSAARLMLQRLSLLPVRYSVRELCPGDHSGAKAQR